MKFKKFTRHLVVAVLLLVSLAVQAQHHPRFDTIRERISNWQHPSTFVGWAATRIWNLRDTHTLTEISGKLNLHYSANHSYAGGGGQPQWSGAEQRIKFVVTERQRQNIEAYQRGIWAINPNHIALAGISYDNTHTNNLPADSDLWLRDEDGNRVPWLFNNFYRLDFTKPKTQAAIINLAIDIAETGLYDGVFLDHWSERQPEAEVTGMINILRGIRDEVHPDFLLLGNANVRILPESAPYMNGIMMEAVNAFPGDTNRDGICNPGTIRKIERVLSWADRNMRQPTINSLGLLFRVFFDSSSPHHHQQMRLFTTMVLTHSDDLVMYFDQYGPRWYAFWDAKLGRPIGPKREIADGSEGSFIREFENGWAVYNRGPEPQFIQLPAVTVSIATGKYDYIHEVGSLDGDMFLRSHPTNVQPRDKLTTSWGKLKSQ